MIEFADNWPLPKRDLAACRAVPDRPIVFPVGLAEPPHLLALRLPA